MSNNGEYTKLVIDNVNRSLGHDIDCKNLGLEHTKIMFCLRESSHTVQTSKCDEIEYSVSLENDATCSITTKPIHTTRQELEDLRDDLFDGRIEIEVFNSSSIYGIRRPLKYNDIILSGSIVFTMFWTLSNPEGNIFSNKNINIYLVTPGVRRIFLDGIEQPSIGVSWSVGDKYRFIKFPNATAPMIYSRFDIDICRGSMEFINNDIVKILRSKRMIDAINSRFCILGSHTTRQRISRYTNFGLGVLLVDDTKIVDSKVLNNIQEFRCNECLKLYTVAEGVSMEYLYCASCLYSFGILFSAGGKYSMHNKCFDTVDINFVKCNSVSVHENVPCYKLTLPMINISAFQPNKQRQFLKDLGINDRSLVSGYYSGGQYRHSVVVPVDSNILCGIYPLIKLYLDRAVYKATLDYDNENVTLEISIYVPENVNQIVLQAACEVCCGTLHKKEKTPLVNNKMYRTFSTITKMTRPQSVMFRVNDSMRFEEMSLLDFVLCNKH